jgi:hypothetical protein
MISGKYFADTCRWVVDWRYPERPMYSPLEAQQGDRVFLRGADVYNFTYSKSRNRACSRLKHIFVVHNSDQNFDQGKLEALLPHAIHIYAINTTVKHPQLTTIPLGVPDAHIQYLTTFKRPDVPRTIEFYMNFSVRNEVQKRLDCYNALKDDSRIVMAGNRTSEQYYDDLCRSKYVLCPEGTGIDTHRVWEAIVCGATPIVLRNSLAHLYTAYPVKIVDSWSECIQ